MLDDVVRKVFVVQDIDEYRGLLSDDWTKRIITLALPATKLSTLVDDLVVEWRAAAYTASLPIAMIDGMKSFHDMYVNTQHVNTVLVMLAEEVPKRLAERIPEFIPESSLNPSTIRRIQEELVKIGAEVEEKNRATQLEFPMKKAWDDYRETQVYQFTLWGSQQIAYVAIYNAYENFIAELVRIARSLQRCRTSNSDFNKQLKNAFGDKLKDKYWTHHRLHVVRCARHALSHAGGRITKDLADIKQTHGFVECEGRINVTPDKTKELFALLQECVSGLAEKAVTMPEFA